MIPLPSQEKGSMVLCPENDGIKDGYDDECNRQGFVPLITDRIIEMEKMLQREIGDSDEDDVEADDDQGTNGEIGDDG